MKDEIPLMSQELREARADLRALDADLLDLIRELQPDLVRRWEQLREDTRLRREMERAGVEMHPPEDEE